MRSNPTELSRRVRIDHQTALEFCLAPVDPPEFYQAWGITEGSPQWRKPEDRAKIW